MAHFDIWIVFWGVDCRYSEVPNECKHSRLKCEGEKREEVASAGENEMPDSYYGAALAGVMRINPGREKRVQRGRRAKKGMGPILQSTRQVPRCVLEERSHIRRYQTIDWHQRTHCKDNHNNSKRDLNNRARLHHMQVQCLTLFLYPMHSEA